MENNRESRKDRLRQVCIAINKAEKREDAITWLGSGDSVLMDRFPSGCPELDVALGGGWPKGRFIEVYGPESGGKSTTCLHAIAEYQRAEPEKDVALVDTEYTFDEIYARNIGVDTELLLVHQPDSGEQALKVVRHLIRHGVGLIIVDSVAALTPKAELEGEIGDIHVGQQARLMSQALRMITSEAGQRGTTIFFTNQVRDKIGVMWGDKTTTSGGRALRHYASVRVNVSIVAKTKSGDEIIGAKVRAEVKKNKTAAPFKRADFYISFGTGIDRVAAVCDSAIVSGVVKKRGAKIYLAVVGHSLSNQIIANGRMDFIEKVKGDNSLFKFLVEQVRIAPEHEDKASDDNVVENDKRLRRPKGIKRTPVLDDSVLPENDGESDADDVEVTDA
jgi:recombination protein RecA